jgi:hypothetical protein
VPLGNGQWSRFMPIAEAERFQHQLKVERFVNMLRAGKHVIELSDDIPAMYDAQERWQQEREAGANSPTQNAD